MLKSFQWEGLPLFQVCPLQNIVVPQSTVFMDLPYITDCILHLFTMNEGLLYICFMSFQEELQLIGILPGYYRVRNTTGILGKEQECLL